MWTRSVIVREVIAKEPAQVILVEDDHVVDAVSTDGSDQALHVGFTLRF
jgi:hypothetical protein